MTEPGPSGSQRPRSVTAWRAAISSNRSRSCSRIGNRQPLASVEVVVAAHRLRRQPPAHLPGVPLADDPSHQVPDDGMGELGLDAGGRCGTR